MNRFLQLFVCSLLVSTTSLPLLSETQPPLKLQAGDRLPIPKSQARPNYPRELRKKGITGVVNLRFVVSSEGNVIDIEVIDSPHEALSQAAVQAVKKWKFEPGLKAGVPVAVRMVMPLEFRLQETPKKKPQS